MNAFDRLDLDDGRVREACRERSALLRIAPHLVHPMPFVVATYGHWLQGSEAIISSPRSPWARASSGTAR